MKKLVLSTLSLGVLALCASQTSAQTVTVDPTTLTLGYMNYFAVSGPGFGTAGAGGYAGGSSWGVPDLTSSFSGSTVTLGPNQINDPSSYWYTPAGGPGAVGAKIMDANLYNESTGTYVSTTLTFTGDVLSDTLANGPVNAIGNGWTSVAFIKDFNAGYGLVNTVTAPLVDGTFSISLPIGATPTDHIQYGFETIGPDVWSTDAGPFGNVVITPVAVPEPATWAWAGSGSLLLLSMFRRRNK
ncbi:MAG TPA: hypothetical protein VNZ25_10540 [Candidatus Angelobacter sp.]|jgi:hypothetical protein|nr:hypothetical protein [Candidatus Angelobacter sp.]